MFSVKKKVIRNYVPKQVKQNYQHSWKDMQKSETLQGIEHWEDHNITTCAELEDGCMCANFIPIDNKQSFFVN